MSKNLGDLYDGSLMTVFEVRIGIVLSNVLFTSYLDELLVMKTKSEKYLCYGSCTS